MTIDLELIARRQRCEQSSLRIALPLLEQGYEPPFLTRYRRDELGSVSERALWDVVAALRAERQLDSRRDELRGKYDAANLDDGALLASIDQAQTPRQLDRIARRIRNESGHTTPASRLAVRLLNPKPNDPVELSELAEMVVGAEHATAAVEGLDGLLGQYLAADSRMVQAATAWMDRHIQLNVLEVHDPHEGRSDDGPDGDESAVTEDTPNTAPKSASAAAEKEQEGVSEKPAEADVAETEQATADEAPKSAIGEMATVEDQAQQDRVDVAGESVETSSPEAVPAPEVESAEEPKSEETKAGETGGAESSVTLEGAESPVVSEALPGFSPKGASGSISKLSGKKGKGKGKDGAEKKSEQTKKKISPRQRRRKWLVSVLQPLKGKSLSKAKLTAFQVVMLGRALRSQVAQCAFKYNASDLVNHLTKTAAGLNEGASNELSQIVIDNEAAIREALEAAWWDDLIDRAARRLISVAADSLRRQMHRQPIEASNVLVIDAVGPRTAAVVAVGPNDKVLHAEDVACQLSKSVRQQLVARLGELVHQYHIDLIVVSNGPARRGCMVALSELLAQSQGSSLRWTLAERAGAEIYAGGPEGNRELRSLPRRFRAAVWLCQSIRSPARALAKVDVSKLRLGSYQRELAEKPLAGALQDVVTSGVSQISVNANAADRGWLASLPGVNDSVAEAIDRQRRVDLFKSRGELLNLDVWPDVVSQRQAIGFLRVYNGTQSLDATAIHPDDYALAEKLMGRLEIPAPPSAPPGYQPPNFDVDDVKVVALENEVTGATFTEIKVKVDPDRPFGEIADGSTESSDAKVQELSADPSSVEIAATSIEAVASETVTAEIAKLGSEQPASEAMSGDATECEIPSAGNAPSEYLISESVTEASTAEATPEAVSAANEPESSSTAEASSTPAQDPESIVSAEADGSTETDALVATSEGATAEPAVEPYKHPMPEQANISRCIKEWQVGESRVRHIVRALCEPFSDSAGDVLEPTATMAVVPKLADLKPGELVSGVVVGISGFGVFVELGPECSGLIHVSRLSEDFVEDLNEFLQIGDVITAWVIEIDSKRRRVSLSGVSPERQAAAREQRNDQRGDRGPRARSGRGGNQQAATSTGQPAANRGGGRGPGKPGGQPAGTGHSSGGGQSSGGVQSGGGGKPSGGGQAGGRDSRGTGRAGGKPGGYGAGNARGGKPGGRRDSGSRGPTTYTTVTRKDAPAAKLTDAMRTGDEPLRSFGDLMAFFKDTKEDAPAPELPTDKGGKPASDNTSESSNSTESGNTSESSGTPEANVSETKPPQPASVETGSSQGSESNTSSEGGSDTVSSAGPAESERTS